MKKSNTSLLFLLIILLCSTLLISNEMVPQTCTIFNYKVLTSVFVFPFTFLIINTIIKKYDSMMALKSILIAIGVQLVFFVFKSWLDVGVISYGMILGTTLGFCVSGAINVCVYERLMEEKENKGLPLFLLYVIVILVDNVIYLSCSISSNISDMSMTMIVSDFVKCFIGLICAIIETFQTWIGSQKKDALSK